MSHYHYLTRKAPKFLRWYLREVADAVAKSCKDRHEPVLYPARSSARNGGRGTRGQAIYFLSLDEPPLMREAREGRRARALVPESGEHEDNKKPRAAEPWSDAPRNVRPSDAHRPSNQEKEAHPNAEPSPEDSAADTAPQKMVPGAQAPMALALSMANAQSGYSSAGWILALALVVILAASGGSASTLVADEIIRVMNVVREALAGGAIVRL